MTNSEIFETVLNGLPYSNQINDIDFHEDGAIRFTWRGTRYRVSEGLNVEEIKDGMLIGSDNSILFRALLEKTRLIKEI